jgi:hypothetical protein
MFSGAVDLRQRAAGGDLTIDHIAFEQNYEQPGCLDDPARIGMQVYFYWSQGQHLKLGLSSLSR